MEKDDRYFMKKALKEAKKAYDIGEIPIGCVLVLDNKIISRGYNKKNSTNIVTKHAEIIAIEKANRKLNNWRLDNVIIYTTLEPCEMCKNVIKSSRIKKVIYATSSNELNSDFEIQMNKINDKYIEKTCSMIIKKQFYLIRKKINKKVEKGKKLQ
ncbi:MAG: nucleoside deaminase [Bacilli bacterium]|nr:nucleoside deaminase [Bacilli bacterium]